MGTRKEDFARVWRPFNLALAFLVLNVTSQANAATLADLPSSILQIHAPDSLLTKPGGYNHTGALFGKPPFGKTMKYSLYYANSDLCDPRVDTSAGYPLRDEDSNGNMLPWPSPFILMVDRGSCIFATKVRNAQRFGAAAVIVADNTCLCSDKKCISGGRDCQERVLVMAGDGTSYDVDIPSVLMSKSDADAVKSSLRANDAVEAELSWPMPKSYDHVEFEFWYTPSDPSITDFAMRIVDAAIALGDRARFTPRILMYDDCQYGKYCTSDTRQAQGYSSSIDRNALQQESLRLLCVWKHYGEDDIIGIKWWDYLLRAKNCKEGDRSLYDTCIEDVYIKENIDGNVIDRCMQKSGGSGGGTNTLFDKEVASTKQLWGYQLLRPSFAVVNGVELLGSLSLHNAFNAICSGYQDGDEPEVCQQCSSCEHDKHSCVILGECSGYRDTEGCGSTSASIGTSSGPGVKASGGVRKEHNAGREGRWGFLFGLLLVGAVLVGVVTAYFLRKNGDPSRTDMEEENPNTPAYKVVDPNNGPAMM